MISFGLIVQQLRQRDLIGHIQTSGQSTFVPRQA